MDTAPHTPLAHILSFWILRSANAVKLNHDGALAGMNLSLNRYLVLKAIAGARRVPTPSSVAKAVGIGPSDATRISQKLESLGLIQRMRSRADQRVVNLGLTPKGSSVLAIADGIVRDADRELLTSTARETVTGLTATLRTIVEKAARWDLADR